MEGEGWDLQLVSRPYISSTSGVAALRKGGGGLTLRAQPCGIHLRPAHQQALGQLAWSLEDGEGDHLDAAGGSLHQLEGGGRDVLAQHHGRHVFRQRHGAGVLEGGGGV